MFELIKNLTDLSINVGDTSIASMDEGTLGAWIEGSASRYVVIGSKL